MDKDSLAEITAHADAEYPKECCGIVVLLPDKRLKVLQCTNDDPEPTKCFRFEANRLLDAEQEGQILYIYHSHPDQSPEMSIADVVQCEELGYPFFVVSTPKHETMTYHPKGLEMELLGRPFVYGIYDCLTLGRDYYRKHFPDLVFPELPVTNDGWWNDPANDQFYINGLVAAGFVIVKDLKPHDLIVMQFRSNQPNHLGVYLGDSYIMHHLLYRKSELAVYGGAWEVITRAILRHKSLL